MGTCTLCGLPASHTRLAGDASFTFEIECERCGKYRISRQAIEILPADTKYLLSYVCRTWSEADPPKILTGDIQKLILRAPLRTIPEKRDWLLELMARWTDMPGSVSKFDIQKDYPLFTAHNAAEAAWFLESLVAVGLIMRTASNAGALTMPGWERVAQLRKAGPSSAFAFVAMSFSGAMRTLFDEAIQPAVRAARYEPFRIDRKEHANSIDDEIIGGIRKSRFMVADFTEQRAGVYFEAGLMMGLGRTVIWMCDKNELEKVHFDVRQRNFIDWDSVDDAKLRLYKRILAIEGEGPVR
jgi:hypothetical protein